MKIGKNSFKKTNEFKYERLIEISNKLGISVTDFKKLVSRVQREKKSLELQKKKWLRLT